MATYFEALGLDPKTATPALAKSAYRKLANEGAHPDRGGDPEKFKLLTAAYNALSTEDKIQTARYGFGDKAYGPWKAQWELLNGPSKSTGANSVLDDLEQMVRDMERRRAQARAQDAEAAWARRDADFARKAREAADRDRRERTERDAQERREQAQRNAESAQRKADSHRSHDGECGAYTKSGPCVRPFGHTPNGHMSAKVKQQKYENYKRRQGRM